MCLPNPFKSYTPRSHNTTQPEAMRGRFPNRQLSLHEFFGRQEDDDLVEMRGPYDRLDRRPVYVPRNNPRNSAFAAFNKPIRDEQAEEQRPPTIIVRFIRQGGTNPYHFDLPIHIASIPTNLNSIPDEIRDAVKVRHPSWRSGFSLQSVVVKWKDIFSETDLIRLNRAQRETAFKRIEENKWLDMVEIKYKRN
jgi:hypothetical protein